MRDMGGPVRLLPPARHLAGQSLAEIKVVISSNEDMVNLEFRDNGPGYTEAVLHSDQHNVGMYLVQTLVRQDLQGQLELYNDHGAVTMIRFKPA